MADFSPSHLDVAIDDNQTFERRWRITQRVVLSLITVALLAAIAGLMGPGLMPPARVSLRTVPFDVTYDRTLRFRTPARITIEGRNGSVGVETMVHVSRDLVDAGGLESTSPEPRSVTADKDGLLYHFATAPGAPGKLILMIRPAEAWMLNSTITVNGAPATLKQFVWP